MFLAVLHSMVISKVCVVGSGFLGTQIGVLSARSGYSVTMYDISGDALRQSESAVKDYIQDWINNGDISDADGGAN